MNSLGLDIAPVRPPNCRRCSCIESGRNGWGQKCANTTGPEFVPQPSQGKSGTMCDHRFLWFQNRSEVKSHLSLSRLGFANPERT